MQKPPKVILITPAYNEQETIHIIVNSGLELVAKGVISDFVVIDDGSTDNTANIAKGLGAKVISLPENRGKGGAFLEGALYAKRAGADILITIDADLVKPLEVGIIPGTIEIIWEPKFGASRIDMAIAPVVEGNGNGTCIASGQRAILMKALNFLFEGKDGEIRFSSSMPAKRFWKMSQGYGLEKALEYHIRKVVEASWVGCIHFLESYRGGKTIKRQEGDVHRSSEMVSALKERLRCLKELKTRGWHMQPEKKGMARAERRLIRQMS